VKRSNLIIGFLVVAILALAGVAVWRGAQRPRGPAPSDIGGPFQLVSDTGAPANESLLKGHWTVVYFGYTFCPDVCPTTLAQLAGAQAALGTRAANLRILFISVDPARDTPSVLRRYLSSPSFPRGVVGLTGTATQIAKVAAAYHVYYARQGKGADYSVDHTSVLYLMDPNGRFVRPLAPAAPTAMATQIAAAMTEG
jgi:protein SCO1/2